MDNLILSNPSSKVYPPTESQSNLTIISENLAKSTALLQVAMCGDFWTCEQSIQYDYLWALSDLVEQTHKLCQFSLIQLKKD